MYNVNQVGILTYDDFDLGSNLIEVKKTTKNQKIFYEVRSRSRKKLKNCFEVKKQCRLKKNHRF